MTADRLRTDALAVWHAAVAAVSPTRLVRRAVSELPAAVRREIAVAPRVIVIGGGKAGAEMAAVLEDALGELTDRLVGVVNVPEGTERPTRHVRLRQARSQGSNHPTAAGVAGTEEMLRLLASAGPDDVAVCLLSGGGSALLPAPADGISLDDKQAVTRQLHACGATIHEMNAVRKHLSRVKGGRLASAFTGRRLVSLIISDVVGDPLDVIASGPTAADPTTYADALAVLDRYNIREHVPAAVLTLLTRGAAGGLPETVKALPPSVLNVIIGSNADAICAAAAAAKGRGYHVLNLGPYVEGETREVAIAVAGITRNILATSEPVAPPACILIGGETTVTLDGGAGKGGRNQEFVLAAAAKLGAEGMRGVAILSGGTDGEDGPTDAAGGVATEETLVRATDLGLDVETHLRQHNAYPFFDAVGSLIRSGLTGTNVMDVRLVLVG